nr:unnamed protein product [Callosobruchus chinensis]
MENSVMPHKMFISDLAYYTGSCYSCSVECEHCSKMNFTKIAIKYRHPCDKILGECRWYDKKFDCCEKFLPLETEYGICYSFSSLHTKPSEIMKMNRSTGPGKLWIKAFEDVRVIEISNEDEIKNLNVEKRGCKFPWENEGLLVHKHYSYSTCVVQCHAENHIRLYKIEYCNVQGLQCLTDYFDEVNRLNAKGFEKPGLVCDCVPSCFEPEYNVVSVTKGRIVLRTDLDLVVSIGGTAGLFIGASLLSIVELVYLCFFGGRD